MPADVVVEGGDRGAHPGVGQRREQFGVALDEARPRQHEDRAGRCRPEHLQARARHLVARFHRLVWIAQNRTELDRPAGCVHELARQDVGQIHAHVDVAAPRHDRRAGETSHVANRRLRVTEATADHAPDVRRDREERRRAVERRLERRVHLDFAQAPAGARRLIFGRGFALDRRQHRVLVARHDRRERLAERLAGTRACRGGGDRAVAQRQP